MRRIIAVVAFLALAPVHAAAPPGGNWPQWRIDREIVFNTAPGGTEVFAVPVNTTGTAFQSGIPQRLSFPPTTGVTTTPQSTPDGQRFLIEVPLDQRAVRTSISVVLNWPALLKQ
jgi:hypothetical protein